MTFTATARPSASPRPHVRPLRLSAVDLTGTGINDFSGYLKHETYEPAGLPGVEEVACVPIAYAVEVVHFGSFSGSSATVTVQKASDPGGTWDDVCSFVVTVDTNAGTYVKSLGGISGAETIGDTDFWRVNFVFDDVITNPAVRITLRVQELP